MLTNFIAQQPPHVVEVLSSNTTSTSAIITWRVSAMAYTPENYTVQYHRLELQTDIKYSEEILGTTDILATNLTYTVILTDLQEASTYSYTVQASNCNGTTITEARNFTTHPDCE